MRLKTTGNLLSTIFLTGVTGFLGGAVLADLLDLPFTGDVVCLTRDNDQDGAEERVRRSVSRFTQYPLERLPDNVSVIRGDLVSDEWHRAPALERVTHVLHLGASTSFGNNRGIRKTNVEGSLSVAAAMCGRPLVRYIHAGTASICGSVHPDIVREDDYPAPGATHLVAYTRSKAEAERLLLERYPHLPIVVARPSIVVGHTRLGCKPSGSIFWVLRAIEELRFITWDPQNRVDVVPVDWTASALRRLLLAPTLKYSRYHVSAGAGSSARWTDVAAECARIYGGAASGRYERGSMHQLTARRLTAALGDANPRYLRQALDLYFRFCSQNLVFDNTRLLEEGIPAPPSITEYLDVCLASSPSSVCEQMRMDLEPAPALA